MLELIQWPAMGSGDDRIRPLSEYMDGMVETLRDLLPKALDHFDEDAVHHARVATRRLRAALDLLAPKLSAERLRPFGRALRKLRRRLGPLRDLDVMIEHMATLPASSPHATAAEWLSEQLLRERRALRAKLAEKNKKKSPAAALAKLGNWLGLRPDVAALDDAVTPLLSESLGPQLDDFVQRADRIAAVQHAGSDTPPGAGEDPHALRIAGKLLRYTLELAAATGQTLPRLHLKTFKRFQDALGLWHDHAVLIQTAMRMAVDTDLAIHNRQRHRQVLMLINAMRRRGDAHMSRFSRLWREHGPVIAQDIRRLACQFAPSGSVAPPPAIEPDAEAQRPPCAGSDLASAVRRPPGGI